MLFRSSGFVPVGVMFIVVHAQTVGKGRAFQRVRSRDERGLLIIAVRVTDAMACHHHFGLVGAFVLRREDMGAYAAGSDERGTDVAHAHTAQLFDVVRGVPQADLDTSNGMAPGASARLRIEPHSPGVDRRLWWGAGSRETAEWTARQGLNLMSSTQ